MYLREKRKRKSSKGRAAVKYGIEVEESPKRKVKEENEAQGVWAKRSHHYRSSNARTLLPRGAPGGDPREYTDVSFSCLMETA